MQTNDQFIDFLSRIISADSINEFSLIVKYIGSQYMSVYGVRGFSRLFLRCLLIYL